MHGEKSSNPSNSSLKNPKENGAQIGNVPAMLRLMRPLNSAAGGTIQGRRQLLADLCRFLGDKVNHTASPQTAPSQVAVRSVGLTPRLNQTLQHLLAGDSEKQVAIKLNLSRHTVHTYVKSLYRWYGVSTRAELLASQLGRQAEIPVES